MKRIIQRLSFVVALTVLGGSLWQLGHNACQTQKTKKALASVQQVYQQATSKPVYQVQNADIRPQFQTLQAINSDIVGWLTIPDTTIDFPILQSKDNDYYLTHNYKKESMVAGSIFKDYRNKNEFIDRNTIIYGHYMDNQQMFGALYAYDDANFLERHPTFTYDTLAVSYDIQVFAVYDTTAQFDYIQTNFANDTEYAVYLKTVQKLSKFSTGVTVDVQDRILTLSTCDLNYSTNGRFVVQGKIIQKK